MSNWGDFDDRPFDVPKGKEYDTNLRPFFALKPGSALQKKITNAILAQIPAGRRYDSMERLETKDGEIIVRINTKKERTNDK